MRRPCLETCSRSEMREYVEWLEEQILLENPPSEDMVGQWVRRVDSDTSKKSAYEVMPKSGSQRARVLAAIWNAGRKGRTRDELSLELHLPSNSVCPRVWELKWGGWVQEDESQVRVTKAGHDAHPVILTPRGKFTIKNYSILRRANGHGPMKIHALPE